MPADFRVRRVLETLRSDWNRDLRIHDLARAVGLGISRLEELFRSELQISIRAFLHHLRLEKAAEQIATTTERISQVVYSVGFRDVSNFNHAFKKRYGLAPKGYRERHQSMLDGSGRRDSNQENASATN